MGKYGRQRPYYHAEGADEKIEMISKALMNDIVSTEDADKTVDAVGTSTFSDVFTIQVEDSDGSPHVWLNDTIDSIISVDSVSPTSGLSSAVSFEDSAGNSDGKITFKNGVATVKISGTEQDWDGEAITFAFANMTINGNAISTGDFVYTFGS